MSSNSSLLPPVSPPLSALGDSPLLTDTDMQFLSLQHDTEINLLKQRAKPARPTSHPSTKLLSQLSSLSVRCSDLESANTFLTQKNQILEKTNKSQESELANNPAAIRDLYQSLASYTGEIGALTSEGEAAAMAANTWKIKYENSERETAQLNLVIERMKTSHVEYIDLMKNKLVQKIAELDAATSARVALASEGQQIRHRFQTKIDELEIQLNGARTCEKLYYEEAAKNKSLTERYDLLCGEQKEASFIKGQFAGLNEQILQQRALVEKAEAQLEHVKSDLKHSEAERRRLEADSSDLSSSLAGARRAGEEARAECERLQERLARAESAAGVMANTELLERMRGEVMDLYRQSQADKAALERKIMEIIEEKSSLAARVESLTKENAQIGELKDALQRLKLREELLQSDLSRQSSAQAEAAEAQQRRQTQMQAIHRMHVVALKAKAEKAREAANRAREDAAAQTDDDEAPPSDGGELLRAAFEDKNQLIKQLYARIQWLESELMKNPDRPEPVTGDLGFGLKDQLEYSMRRLFPPPPPQQRGHAHKHSKSPDREQTCKRHGRSRSRHGHGHGHGHKHKHKHSHSRGHGLESGNARQEEKENSQQQETIVVAPVVEVVPVPAAAPVADPVPVPAPSPVSAPAPVSSIPSSSVPSSKPKAPRPSKSTARRSAPTSRERSRIQSDTDLLLALQSFDRSSIERSLLALEGQNASLQQANEEIQQKINRNL